MCAVFYIYARSKIRISCEKLYVTVIQLKTAFLKAVLRLLQDIYKGLGNQLIQ